MIEGMPLDFIRDAWPHTLAELPRPRWLEQTAVAIVFELGRQFQLRESNRAAAERLKELRAATIKRKPGRPARRGDDYAEHVMKDVDEPGPWDPDEPDPDALDFG